ncbi:MAG: FAD-dependent oxidoreductase [Candidatus Aceula meridiana]|nr:FAD-dependent oxidoreductase [Candidatus Aceula meridiana]
MDKAVDKIIKCDVVVIGAGVSGVCAAVTAARNGLKVLLVEKNNYLGGAANKCMHKAVCGLYANNQKGPCDVNDTLNKGISQELVHFLESKYNITETKRIGKVFVLPLPDNSLASFLTTLLDSQKNAISSLNTEIYAIDKKGNQLSSLKAKKSGESISIEFKIVIDCSGDSVVSRLAGIPFLTVDKEKQQLCGYIAKVVKIEGGDESLMIKVPYWADKFVALEGAPDFLKYTTYIQGDTLEEGYLKMNIPHSSRNLKEEYLTKIFQFITGHLQEMKNAQIEKTSEEVFARDSSGTAGEYVLTEEDVLGARKFDDGVIRGAWPIEQWLEEKGTCYKYVKENDYYEIPKRCLKSKTISNLISSGKCISASHEAVGSIRVMGTCMSLGEASGSLASEMIRR